MDWFIEQVRWMQWSTHSIIFFIALFGTIIGMGIWDGFQPAVSRKGFFPMWTTRGDRLFLGIISTIGICLMWIALFADALMLIPLLLSAIWFFIVAKWG
jgi:predicted small integral membrane protein